MLLNSREQLPMSQSKTEKVISSYTDHSLALACLRAREAVVSNFSPMLRDLEVTEQQWRVLRILFEHEYLYFAELCRLSCIHKVSMARIVSNLIERNWVCRTRSERDSRAYTVALTDGGRKVVGPAVKVTSKVYDDLFEEFGRQKAMLLLELLNDLEKIRRR